ncbi:FecR family protein [Lampropedia hyalina DSM 16112]|jgi:transmembrane sensor|uniref:FecR family protein n=1 Tax=Lampropedia hyalina DSM 16112 TaxID=1122156 RepID=A0A1M4YRH7_9BURK|nr:FecR family protein [Lampropedia hyalina]SHF08469.1 FecR family protein [Lampropedia hyalina DSM 16112]
MQQAAEWFALLSSGNATDADRLRWQSWLAAAPAHQQAWSYVDAVSQDMAQLQKAVNQDVVSDKLIDAHQRISQRRKLLSLAAFIGLGSISWAVWRHTGLQGKVTAWHADHHTATGTIHALTLPDASQVWLNTASAINIDYSAGLRRIELVQGEVLIATAADAVNRPFVVDTLHGRMQALGTRFSVRLLNEQTRLTVFESAVRVHPAQASDSRLVQSGQQVHFNDQTILAAASALPDGDSWANGVLQAHRMTLAELVAELRRYYRGHIGLADEIAHLRVVGSFRLDDVPRSLQVLETVLPVRVQQTLPWWISIEAD